MEDKKFINQLHALADQRNLVAAGYVKHLVDPEHTPPVGIPDIAIGMNDTALLPTIMSVDIPVNFDGTQDSGRFGMIVSPTMGDSAEPSSYKIALVDSSSGWPTDFSLPASYLTNVKQTDLTVDPNTRMMLNPPTTFANVDLIAAAGNFDSPVGSGSGFMVYDPTTDNYMNPNVGAPQFISTGLVTQGVFAGRNADILSLPPGQYLIGYEATFNAGLGDPSAQAITVPQTSNNVAWSQMESTGSITTCTFSAILSVFETSGQIYLCFSGVALPTTSIVANLELTTSWARPDKLAAMATNGWVTQPNISLAPAYPIDGGVIREYVPVAMSVLLSCIAPELVIAGDVACAWLPPNTCANDVFTNIARAQVGNLLNVENTRRLPMHFEGKFRDGLYQVWRPSGTDDTHLYSPSSARDRDWPCLVLSGKITGGAAGSQTVARVRVCSTYQFSTDVKGFDLRKRPGSREAMDQAFTAICSFPLASANGKHWDNIKRFFANAVRDVSGFYNANESWIKPLGQMVLTGAGAL